MTKQNYIALVISAAIVIIIAGMFIHATRAIAPKGDVGSATSTPAAAPKNVTACAEGKCYQADQFQFNQTGTCIILDQKEILCGTFEVAVNQK